MIDNIIFLFASSTDLYRLLMTDLPSSSSRLRPMLHAIDFILRRQNIVSRDFQSAFDVRDGMHFATLSSRLSYYQYQSLRLPYTRECAAKHV